MSDKKRDVSERQLGRDWGYVSGSLRLRPST